MLSVYPKFVIPLNLDIYIPEGHYTEVSLLYHAYPVILTYTIMVTNYCSFLIHSVVVVVFVVVVYSSGF